MGDEGALAGCDSDGRVDGAVRGDGLVVGWVVGRRLGLLMFGGGTMEGLMIVEGTGIAAGTGTEPGVGPPIEEGAMRPEAICASAPVAPR